MRNLVLTFVFWLIIPFLAAAQNAPHPLTFDDAAALRHAGVVAVSPDGKTLLYHVRFGGDKRA